MQYRNYDIQNSSSGSVIRNSKGDFIVEVPTEQEAKEYIDEMVDDDKEELQYDLYEKFVRYCKNLPQRHFIDGKLCSYNERLLKQFAKNFEEKNKAHVTIVTQYINGEYHYVVESVERI